MKEKQMTIDEFLNEGETVQMMNTAEIPTKGETITPEVVDYNTLSKEELIRIISDKDTAINNYETKLHDGDEAHKNELDNMNNFYTDKIKELTHLIKYYERKIKIISDIINIETGNTKEVNR